ncbi:hypothetical protein RB195_002596 [Necator americanus]|uniref:Uncharacterized protein n=1 Tax=Necator americanus TaxID=51031 RepID=A0ABR1DK22_NECAM
MFAVLSSTTLAKIYLFPKRQPLPLPSSGAVEHLKNPRQGFSTYGMFGRLRDFSATNSSLIELSRSTKCIQLLKGTEQQHRSKFEAKSFA